MKFFLIGLVSGIVGGMGIGGGTLLIPALYILTRQEQHIAQGVNLLFFIPTALAACAIHIKNKKVDFEMAIPILITGLLGTYLGSKLAAFLSGITLKKWFGIFLFAMGLYEMFRRDKRLKERIMDR